MIAAEEGSEEATRDVVEEVAIELVNVVNVVVEGVTGMVEGVTNAVEEVVMDVVEGVADSVEEAFVATLSTRIGVVASTERATHLNIPAICCIW